MKLEFKKSKYPIFKIAFWILIFCSIVMISLITKYGAYRLDVKGFSEILNPVSLNISSNRHINEQVFVCFNDFCKAPVPNSKIAQRAGLNYIYSASYNFEDKDFYNQKIKSVSFAIPKDIKNFKNKFEEIDLFVGEKAYHYNFSDLEKMNKKIVPIEISNTNKKIDFIVYTFDIGNYVGLANHLLILFISLLVNCKFYIITYSWLLIAFLIFLFNKDAFKIDFKKKLIYSFSGFLFVLIFFGAIFFMGPKIKNDVFLDFVAYDIQKYPEDIKIHIISNKKEDYYQKYFKNNKDVLTKNIVWHSVEKPVNGIDKDAYVKDNKKTIIYLSSDITDTMILSISNPRAKIYNLNSINVASITYN